MMENKNSIKPRSIIVRGKRIHLLSDLIIRIVEKYNFGVVQAFGDNPFGANNELSIYFWAKDDDYSSVLNAISKSNFDIEVIAVIEAEEK